MSLPLPLTISKFDILIEMFLVAGPVACYWRPGGHWKRRKQGEGAMDRVKMIQVLMIVLSVLAFMPVMSQEAEPVSKVLITNVNHSINGERPWLNYL